MKTGGLSRTARLVGKTGSRDTWLPPRLRKPGHAHNVPICTISTLLTYKLPSPPPSPGGYWGRLLGGDVCQGGLRDQAGGREGSRGAAYAGTEHSAVAQCL